MRSSGSASRIARTTVSPPRPESKMPRGPSGAMRALRLFDPKNPRRSPQERLALHRRQRSAHRSFGAGVCDDANGDGLAGTLGPALLHHLLDTDALAAERRSDAANDPRMVSHVEAKVVARFDLVLSSKLAIFEH